MKQVQVHLQRVNHFTEFTVNGVSYDGDRKVVQVGGVQLVQQTAPAPGNNSPGNSTVSAVTFAGQILITVNHNRGYRPLIAVTSTNGDEIDGAINHLSLNTFTIGFNVPQSGQIIYQ